MRPQIDAEKTHLHFYAAPRKSKPFPRAHFRAESDSRAPLWRQAARLPVSRASRTAEDGRKLFIIKLEGHCLHQRARRVPHNLIQRIPLADL